MVNGYYNNGFGGFNMSDSYGAQLYMAMQNERRCLKKNAITLGVLLLAYELLIYLSGYVFYFVYASVASGKAILSWNGVKDFFRDKDMLTSSSSFAMGYSAFVVCLSFIVLMLIARLFFKIKISHIYRLERGQAKTAVICFPAVMTVNLLLSLIIGIVTLIFSEQGIVVPEADFSISEASASAFFFQVLYGVIVAPIVEESLYRGLAIHLLKPYGKGMAVIVSSLIFGLMHGNISQAVNGFCFALVMGTITVSCNSIVPTIIVHILNNAVAEIPDISQVLPTLSGDMVYEIYLAVAIACFVLGTLVIFKYHRKIKLPKDDGCVLSAGERYKTAMFNLPMIVYWCTIGYMFVKSFIDAN